jgi:hypothetical protein
MPARCRGLWDVPMKIAYDLQRDGTLEAAG